MPDMAERDLPYIDEHSRRIDGDVADVWIALGRLLARPTWPVTTVAVQLLGAQPARRSGDPLTAGSTVPGFAVTRATKPVELALRGRHRFARYALTFQLEPDAGATVMRAESRAEFPGPAGRLYRTLVIGSRGHVIAVRRLLAAVERLTVPASVPTA